MKKSRHTSIRIISNRHYGNEDKNEEYHNIWCYLLEIMVIVI